MFSNVLVLTLAVGGVLAQGHFDVPATGSVSFTSPNYPSNYADNIRVTYSFTGPAGSIMEFNAEDFDTENGPYDTLALSEVVNGQSRDVGTFSGVGGPNRAKSQTNHVTGVFKSDSNTNGRGFKIAVSVPVCEYGHNLCPGSETKCLRANQYCDGKVDCPNGSDENRCPAPGSCGRQTIKPDISRFQALVNSIAKKDNGRIVGGTEANPHSWPWQVAFYTATGSQICGGSLINSEWVMTAAHCCQSRGHNPSPSLFTIRVGTHNLRANADQEPNARTIAISRIISHPNYKTIPTSFDFCLLKLAEPVVVSEHVAPVCLPTSEHGLTGERCWVTGWGGTRANRGSFDDFMREVIAAEEGRVPKNTEFAACSTHLLRQVDVAITDQARCNTAYDGQISADMICAASPGKDSCQGDSGGPLVCEHDGEYKLVGVVSFGVGCARETHPGVYARTAVVLDWISETIYG